MAQSPNAISERFEKIRGRAYEVWEGKIRLNFYTRL
jgi:hypothetical protein